MRSATTARRAFDVARALRTVVAERVERAAEPVHTDARWVSAYRIDPFTVPTADKVALLIDRVERLTAADGVAHATAGVQQVKENKFYADLAGTTTIQQRVRIQPEVEAVSVDPATGAFETMASLAPPTGRGWEYLVDGWQWDAEIAEMPTLLAEKTQGTVGPLRAL